MILRDLTRSTREKNIISTDISPVETKIWTEFTYFGRDIRTLTKILKNIRLKLAFNVNNTIKIRCKSSGQYDRYKNSGIYQLKCLTCEQVYIGQTGTEFSTRYKEHITDIRFNYTKSKYAQHILECNHAYGKIEDTMEVIK
jgi:predicted GIY-YIG superfamily endonuclease